MSCDPAAVLLAQFARRLGPLTAVDAGSTPWFSATFSGARHCLQFDVATDADIDAFIAAIGEVDLPMHRHFVAEAVATRSGQRVTVEALTIAAD